MAITAAMVKELRDKTGAGMMDSKKALSENNGDMEASIDWLRAKGIAKADKKAGRTAAEGLVGVAGTGTTGAAVEINSETDFVARNADFQKMVAEIATLSAGIGSTGNDVIADVNAATLPSTGKSVEESIKDAVGTVGENMAARRAARLSVENGVVASYVHNATAPGMGKIGVLIALESTGDADKLNEFGRKVAMHVAANAPASLDVDDLDPALVEREKSVLTEQARESGKPDNVIEKMIVGRMNKFYQEVCLMKQAFVMDPDITVEKAVENAGNDVGAPVKLAAYVRLAVGEGIEKEEEDFAAEVAKTMGG